MGRIYHIDHHTRYVYASVVNTSQHVAWLEPRALPFQQVHSYAIAIDPPPARELRRADYFGNAVHQFQLLRPHGELSVVTHSEVEVHPRRTAPLDPAASPPWDEVRRSLRESPADRSVAEFLYQSPQTTGAPEIATYARQSFPDGRPVLEGAIDLMHRIHHEFIFDPAATNPATPVSRVLEERRGVCQDFAHFQIACLRSLGLAAPLCQRLHPHRPAAGAGAPDRRRRVACLAVRVLPGSRLGRSRSDQRRGRRRSPHHRGMGAGLQRRHAAARRAPGRRGASALRRRQRRARRRGPARSVSRRSQAAPRGRPRCTAVSAVRRGLHALQIPHVRA